MDPKNTKVRLIASDDPEPRVRLAAGKRYEVVVTSVVDHDLNEIDGETEDPQLRSPRLCGSKSTCMAIVETADDV